MLSRLVMYGIYPHTIKGASLRAVKYGFNKLGFNKLGFIKNGFIKLYLGAVGRGEGGEAFGSDQCTVWRGWGVGGR